jgi:hypothetical protein
MVLLSHRLKKETLKSRLWYLNIVVSFDVNPESTFDVTCHDHFLKRLSHEPTVAAPLIQYVQ